MADETIDLDLQAVIDGVRDQLDDEELDIAQRAIVEGSRVSIRKLAGEDVDEDLATLRATASNLSHRANRVVQAAVLSYVQQVVRGVLALAIG